MTTKAEQLSSHVAFCVDVIQRLADGEQVTIGAKPVKGEGKTAVVGERFRETAITILTEHVAEVQGDVTREIQRILSVKKAAEAKEIDWPTLWVAHREVFSDSEIMNPGSDLSWSNVKVYEWNEIGGRTKAMFKEWCENEKLKKEIDWEAAWLRQRVSFSDDRMKESGGDFGWSKTKNIDWRGVKSDRVRGLFMEWYLNAIGVQGERSEYVWSALWETYRDPFCKEKNATEIGNLDWPEVVVVVRNDFMEWYEATQKFRNSGVDWPELWKEHRVEYIGTEHSWASTQEWMAIAEGMRTNFIKWYREEKIKKPVEGCDWAELWETLKMDFFDENHIARTTLPWDKMPELHDRFIRWCTEGKKAGLTNWEKRWLNYKERFCEERGLAIGYLRWNNLDGGTRKKFEGWYEKWSKIPKEE